MKRTQTDIFISGGGVAGLTAAAAFGTAGFSVVIVDPATPVTQADDAAADLRTTAFLQPARAFLDRAGVWSHLSEFATPLQVMRIVDATGPAGNARTTRDFDAADISDQPFGWNLPNWLLRREILNRIKALPHVDFRPRVGFSRMVTRSTSALLTLSDGSGIDAQLVIGADGRGSPVRDAAGIAVTTARYGQMATTFAVTHAAPHNNISTEIHRHGGPFTLVPLPDHNGLPCSAVVWMAPNDDVNALSALDDAAFEAAATDRSAHLYGPLRLATRRSTWPIVSQHAHSITAERTALVAEAAHVMPPIGAQGLNMSLRDLDSLLDLSVANRDTLGSTAMLDAYSRDRLPDIKLRVRGIDLLNRTSMAGSPLLQDLRNFGVRALHDVAPLRKSLMKLGLGVR